jgi:putative Mn2+ efflux pump MntP
MDAFAVSICKGLAMPKATLKAGLTCGLWFGGFQALMPLIGFFLGTLFADAIQAIDHWVAFVLLAIIGINMLKEAFEKGDGCECCCEHDADLSVKTMFLMAVATSIDALAVGISFACTGMDTLQDILWPIVIIGIVSFLFSMLGCFIGVFFGKRINLRAELWAGIILIGIGVKILMEHMEWI